MVVTEGLTKLLYVVVTEDDDVGAAEKGETTSFSYTRSVLQSTLQLMGCKPRHAFKISQRVFEIVRQAGTGERLVSTSEVVSKQNKESMIRGTDCYVDSCLDKVNTDSLAMDEDKDKNKPFELYKRRTTVTVRRKFFLDITCDALSEYKYVGPNQRADLAIACRIRERKESVIVLLCGTSGCGKSTLSSLLGSRLGITTIVSTDSIRHMMRGFLDEKQDPLVWASTYHAGECLDPVAVAEARAKRKAKKSGEVPATSMTKQEPCDNYETGKLEGNTPASDLISQKQMAIEGFKAQSEMVIDSLDRLMTAWEKRKESVIVEGVHLSLNFVMGLMKKHPSIIPFMVYIASEEKHLERFAVRAKYMTLDPARNKYVKYIRNIRSIQNYLCNRADKHLVPKINNTNVDRSVALIHATVFSCLRRRDTGDQLYDPLTNTIAVIDEEYRNQLMANSLSSKGMFQLIQRQGSNRRLMALLNNDGSVAKAWPVDIMDDNGNPIQGHTTKNGLGIPMYGPLQIGKAEPVNLQFGNFGISAWPSDTGGTSRASSVDESRGDLTDNASRCFSSGCSSPRAAAKELKEDMSVNGSDEEPDDPPEVDSDEDFNDKNKHLQEELEGSIYEGSIKSDEEYDDLDTQDFPDKGYIPDDDELFQTVVNRDIYSVPEELPNGNGREKYKQNLDLFLRTKNEPLSESSSESSPLKCKSMRRSLPPGNCKVRKRSLSIPSIGCTNRVWTFQTIKQDFPEMNSTQCKSSIPNGQPNQRQSLPASRPMSDAYDALLATSVFQKL